MIKKVQEAASESDCSKPALSRWALISANLNTFAIAILDMKQVPSRYWNYSQWLSIWQIFAVAFVIFICLYPSVFCTQWTAVCSMVQNFSILLEFKFVLIINSFILHLVNIYKTTIFRNWVKDTPSDRPTTWKGKVVTITILNLNT